MRVYSVLLFVYFESWSLLTSYGDHVQHFKVLKDRDGYYFIWEEIFPSLNQLVEFYKTNSIARERTVFLRDTEDALKVRQHLYYSYENILYWVPTFCQQKLKCHTSKMKSGFVFVF